MGRPLDRKRVALDGRGIAVALDRPGVHRLAAPLLERRERTELPANPATGFLLELPPRGCERVLIGSELTLGDGPRAQILLRPEWTTGMDEEDFEAARGTAVE